MVTPVIASAGDPPPVVNIMPPKMMGLFFEQAEDGSIILDQRGQPIYAPSDYKVAYGGRGSGKSEGVIGMSVLLQHATPQRVLYFRETQNSIADSVHALIVQKIEEFGLRKHFIVYKDRIASKRTGSESIFAGIRTDPNKIKSMSGLTLAVGEEMEAITEDSWSKLLPTLRGRNGVHAELWGMFNPETEDSPVYRAFVGGPLLPSARIVKINWRDNPWFPARLERLRRAAEAADMDAYLHIWEGELRISSAAQILHGCWVVDSFEVPEDAYGPYYGLDWGFSQDPLAIVRCWITPDNCLLIDHERYDTGVEFKDLAQFADAMPDIRSYQILADNSRPESINFMQTIGFACEAANKWPGSVEDGIAFLRGFNKIVIHPRCKNMKTEAMMYRYKEDRLTKQITRVPVDKNNHLIDALRYALSPIIQSSDITARFRVMSQ